MSSVAVQPADSMLTPPTMLPALSRTVARVMPAEPSVFQVPPSVGAWAAPPRSMRISSGAAPAAKPAEL